MNRKPHISDTERIANEIESLRRVLIIGGSILIAVLLFK